MDGSQTKSQSAEGAGSRSFYPSMIPPTTQPSHAQTDVGSSFISNAAGQKQEPSTPVQMPSVQARNHTTSSSSSMLPTAQAFGLVISPTATHIHSHSHPGNKSPAVTHQALNPTSVHAMASHQHQYSIPDPSSLHGHSVIKGASTTLVYHPHGIQDESRMTAKQKKDVKRRTKTGCMTCRKRRIKCDETRPICRNCLKSKRDCHGYETGFKSQNQSSPIPLQPAANQPGSSVTGANQQPHSHPNTDQSLSPGTIPTMHSQTALEDIPTLCPPLPPAAEVETAYSSPIPASPSTPAEIPDPGPGAFSNHPQSVDSSPSISLAHSITSPAPTAPPVVPARPHNVAPNHGNTFAAGTVHSRVTASAPPPNPTPAPPVQIPHQPPGFNPALSMNMIFKVGGFPPQASTIIQHDQAQRHKIHSMYKRLFSYGLDELLEGSWFQQEGFQMFTRNQALMSYFSICVGCYSSKEFHTNSLARAMARSTEVKLTWDLYCLCREVEHQRDGNGIYQQDQRSAGTDLGSRQPNMKFIYLQEVRGRLAIIECLITGKVAASNPVDSIEYPPTLPASKAFEIKFWHTAGILVTLRLGPSTPEEEAAVAETLTRARGFTLMNEYREIVYSMMIVRHYGPLLDWDNGIHGNMVPEVPRIPRLPADSSFYTQMSLPNELADSIENEDTKRLFLAELHLDYISNGDYLEPYPRPVRRVADMIGRYVLYARGLWREEIGDRWVFSYLLYPDAPPGHEPSGNGHLVSSHPSQEHHQELHQDDNGDYPVTTGEFVKQEHQPPHHNGYSQALPLLPLPPPDVNHSVISSPSVNMAHPVAHMVSRSSPPVSSAVLPSMTVSEQTPSSVSQNLTRPLPSGTVSKS